MIKYCKECEDDIDRMNAGYNPQGTSCTRWQCSLLQTIEFIWIGIVSLIFLIPMLILIIIIVILNYFGEYDAIQKQTNEKEIHAGLGRKKSRKSRMGQHSLARRKSRSKK